MVGIRLAVICILSVIASCEASKQPKIELFEIRNNVLTNDISLEPVELQYDIESKEDNLKQLVFPPNKNSKYNKRLLQENKDSKLYKHLLPQSKKIKLSKLIYPESNEAKVKRLQRTKKVDDPTVSMLKRFQALQAKAGIEEQKKEPVILILTSDNNIINDILSKPVQTATLIERSSGDKLLVPRNDVKYHIVPPNEEKRFPNRKPHLPSILRSQTLFPEDSDGPFAQDRTSAPRHRYIYDRK